MSFPDFGGFEDEESSYWQEPDTVLTNIVAVFVNMMDMPIGVTLFVKGMVISGTLVSEREYLKRLSSTFTDMAKRVIQPKNKKEQQALEEMFNFQEMEEGWYPEDDEEDEIDVEAMDSEEGDDESYDLGFDPEQIPPVIRHLHLTDVSIVSPQPSPVCRHGGPLHSG